MRKLRGTDGKVTRHHIVKWFNTCLSGVKLTVLRGFQHLGVRSLRVLHPMSPKCYIIFVEWEQSDMKLQKEKQDTPGDKSFRVSWVPLIMISLPSSPWKQHHHFIERGFPTQVLHSSTSAAPKTSTVLKYFRDLSSGDVLEVSPSQRSTARTDQMSFIAHTMWVKTQARFIAAETALNSKRKRFFTSKVDSGDFPHCISLMSKPSIWSFR